MNETRITVVGTALNKPERKVLEKSGAVVASFRIISNSRRHDRQTDTWIDGPYLKIKVNCWRRVAEHVLASVESGDPLVVNGRITTREWKTEAGENRMTFEVDADSVGHDLSRGTAVFSRSRAGGSSTVIDDAETDNRVNGEPTITSEAFGGEDDGYRDITTDAMTMLRAAGLEPTPGGEEENDEEELVGAAAGSGGSAGRSRRRGRAPELV
jgi:single-strand DNA-binding protein